MTRKNKLLAWLLVIAVFFAMMLSVTVITHNADHECVGMECQVCQQTESARQLLETLISGAMAMAFAFGLTCAGCRVIRCFAGRLPQGTLVALKVELLN